MKLIIKYILAAAVASLCFSSCDKWLNVKPYDKIAEEDLLSSEDGFIQLLNGIYIELNSDMLYGGALSVEMIEIMGGAYTIGSDNSVWGNFKDLSEYEYETEYWRARMSETWDKAYSLILNCNLLLGNIDAKKALFTGDNYSIIKGEAFALRAMLHFDMLRIFGPVYSRNPDGDGIPYYTAYTTTPESILPASEVAKKVLKDLKEARILLSGDPVKTEGVRMDGPADGSSTFLYYRNLRLNYYAVTALLARASLYFGDKDAAKSYASEVIAATNAKIFSFVDKSLVTGSPDDPDRIFSSEIIFALSHTQRNKIFKNYFDPSRIPNFVFRMDNELFSDRIYGGSQTGGSQDDYRCRVNWIATGSNRYFHKYSDMTDTGNIRNTMIPMLRLGEMYLIAAESQTTLNDGLSLVNTLRSNRGVGSLTSLTQNTLQYEYIRELYGEGQIFFMYKRMFSPIITSVNDNKNPEPSERIFCVPLPDSEKLN